MSEQLRLRQICLVAPELERAVEDMSAILGLPVCHRDPNVATFGVENALFAAGTTFLEIIAPTREGTAAGRFLERSGGRGGYIALFDCPDPKRRQAHAESIGVSTAFTIDRPGIYQCVQLHPRDCRATMLEFDRTEGGEELTGPYWPAGGDGWQRYMDQSRTRGVTGIEATSPDPAGLARHWAAILERAVDHDAIAVDGATVGFGPSDDGKERLETIILDAADPEAIMAEARSRGKDTGSDRFALCGMTFRVSR
ncbi:MAG: hypothetical protein JWN21_153 [Sphingomonas bacterium]|uniref:VOC family protein n=1 Tax=Sphingomonas bacterium TaxID=1895847 RepID=UPI002622B015|nr:VOC family protein [Sphingomonas bacterium]MDB5694610.1 hypothetical protein [Sphingomonas bacterium]